MARPPRKLIRPEEGGFFHVVNRVSGPSRWFPFRSKLVSAFFMAWLRICLQRSPMRLAAYVLMGNHFHLTLLVPAFRYLDRAELENFARLRFGRLWSLRTRCWDDQKWLQFNRDLFSLDAFMRDFQSWVATWFNRSFDHRGCLWGSRYKATRLEGLEAVQECLFYNELNPVRAALTQLPERWKYSSASDRFKGKDDLLIPLQELFPECPPKEVWAWYRARLLYRGRTRTKDNQAVIPEHIIRMEELRGFAHPGIYLRRHRFWTDGLILGSASAIAKHLKFLKMDDSYAGRSHPASQLGGVFFSLKSPRPSAP